MATWAQTMKAFQDAAVSASGLSDAKVIWNFQNSNAPAEDYVSMSLGPAIGVGEDAIRATTDLDRPAGQEIALTVLGIREMAWQLQIFTAASLTTASVNDALTLGEIIKAKLNLPTVRGILAAVGVSPFGPGPVLNIPDVPAARFRGRATFDVRCYLPAQAVVEYTAYIATVNGETTTHGGGGGNRTVPFTAP